MPQSNRPDRIGGALDNAERAWQHRRVNTDISRFDWQLRCEADR
jgi:hypothetical protein